MNKAGIVLLSLGLVAALCGCTSVVSGWSLPRADFDQQKESRIVWRSEAWRYEPGVEYRMGKPLPPECPGGPSCNAIPQYQY